MTLMKPPVSVELTFEDGTVKHFQSKLGDGISMSELEDKSDNNFYTLILAPNGSVANGQKDKI